MKLAHLVVPVMVVISACAAAREAAPPPMTADAPPPAAPKHSCDRQRPAGCVGSVPSFARDVAPILQRRCFSCHADGGMAADDHDFARFTTLHAQRDAVIAEVGACAMPPPQAKGLESVEADLLLRWAACGAPEN